LSRLLAGPVRRRIFFYFPALGRNAQPTGSRIAVSARRPRPALEGGKNRISMHWPSAAAIRRIFFYGKPFHREEALFALETGCDFYERPHFLLAFFGGSDYI
jgi:hypothetical protein